MHQYDVYVLMFMEETFRRADHGSVICATSMWAMSTTGYSSNGIANL